jgi:hypothetical protein
MERQRQVKDDALMASARRRRHEELAPNKLVPRDHTAALLDEPLDLGGRPDVRTHC